MVILYGFTLERREDGPLLQFAYLARSKLYELLSSNTIASVRIDGSRRIPLSALEDYVSRLLAERTAA